MAGMTIDAGALIGVDRHDRRVLELLARARRTGSRFRRVLSLRLSAIRNGRRVWPGSAGRARINTVRSHLVMPRVVTGDAPSVKR